MNKIELLQVFGGGWAVVVDINGKRYVATFHNLAKAAEYALNTMNDGGVTVVIKGEKS